MGDSRALGMQPSRLTGVSHNREQSIGVATAITVLTMEGDGTGRAPV